jgi:hypothetical protein
MTIPMACEPCTRGQHEGCPAREADCNLCHPGYDPEAYVVAVSGEGQYGTEYALMVRGTGRGFFTGSGTTAQQLVEDMLRGIHADERWRAQAPAVAS